MTNRLHDDGALVGPGALGIGFAPARTRGCDGWWFAQDLSGAASRTGRDEVQGAARPGGGRSQRARVRSNASFGRG